MDTDKETDTESKFINLFNKKLLEFANDLVSIFPSMYDFQIFQIAVEWSIKIDIHAPLSFFNYHIKDRFHQKILNKDESFFLCESFEDCNKYIDHYGHDLNLIEKLKNIWQTLDEDNKSIIWRYMQVLLIVSEKCKPKNLNDLHKNIFVAKRV